MFEQDSCSRSCSLLGATTNIVQEFLQHFFCLAFTNRSSRMACVTAQNVWPEKGEFLSSTGAASGFQEAKQTVVGLTAGE